MGEFDLFEPVYGRTTPRCVVKIEYVILDGIRARDGEREEFNAGWMGKCRLPVTASTYRLTLNGSTPLHEGDLRMRSSLKRDEELQLSGRTAQCTTNGKLDDACFQWLATARA